MDWAFWEGLVGSCHGMLGSRGSGRKDGTREEITESQSER